MEHESSLEYHTADDGIWLRCECGFMYALGFSPPVEKVEIEWNNHLKDVYEKESDRLIKLKDQTK